MSDFARYEGLIHDRVNMWDGDGAERRYTGDVTVLAGRDETDSVGFQIQVSPTHFSLQLLPADAIRLGHLLVAAGEDTLSRSPTPSDAGTDEAEATP